MSHLCDPIKEQLSDYIDDELAARLCAEIEAHLAECQNCRVMVDTLRKTIYLYREQSPAEMPSDVKERLYKVLDLEPFLQDPSDPKAELPKA